MTGVKYNKLETECCFPIEVIYNDQQPIGFENWSQLITYEKCRVTLPDKSSIDIRMYIDLNGVFNNYDFTNFLLNRYNETL
jgi:hypothetical protein